MVKHFLKLKGAVLLLLFISSGCVSHNRTASLQTSNDLKNKEIFSKKENKTVGIASWYGPRFYGRKTASGERFTKHQLTCAHRTLPFGTKLEVTNLLNDQTVEVVVNDRGPFVGRRIIDLSYAAAKKIGLIKTGTTKVAIRQVNPTSNQLDEIISEMEQKKSPEAAEISLKEK